MTRVRALVIPSEPLLTFTADGESARDPQGSRTWVSSRILVTALRRALRRPEHALHDVDLTVDDDRLTQLTPIFMKNKFMLGEEFSMPFVSDETVVQLRDGSFLLANDNNFPGDDARVDGEVQGTQPGQEGQAERERQAAPAAQAAGWWRRACAITRRTKTGLPSRYRRHMRFGSIASRKIHSSPLSANQAGARGTRPET